MPKSRTLLSKHWCFTINNPTDDDKLTAEQREEIEYLIVNREVGEEGTPHWQGYVVFLNRKRLTTVKKFFPRAHLEIKRGTVAEAIHYSMKPVPGCDCDHCETARPLHEADWRELGTRPTTASASRKKNWNKLITLAKRGDFDAIEEEFPSDYWRSYHLMKKIRQDHPDKPEDLKKLDNYWIVAPTGHGKSRYARERWPEFYDKSKNKWWIGYQDEPTILIDDIDRDQCKYLYSYMKRWADLYSFPMEEKGSGRQIRPERIVVTSQYSIDYAFADVDNETVEALERRFKTIELEHWKKREGREFFSDKYNVQQ